MEVETKEKLKKPVTAPKAAVRIDLNLITVSS